MDMENIYIRMVIFLKVNFNKEKDKELVNIHGRMGNP